MSSAAAPRKGRRDAGHGRAMRGRPFRGGRGGRGGGFGGGRGGSRGGGRGGFDKKRTRDSDGPSDANVDGREPDVPADGADVPFVPQASGKAIMDETVGISQYVLRLRSNAFIFFTDLAYFFVSQLPD